MTALKDLVEIRSGYTFRGAIDSFETGNTEVIQAKDLGSDFGLASYLKINFPGESIHLLKPGEILVSARGFSKAQLIRDERMNAVASSSLFVLTPKKPNTNPEFITMFFNSEQGMKAVFGLGSSGSVRSITKDSLGQIVIPSIPPDKERALGRVVQAIDDELSAMELKKIYVNNIREAIISKTLKEAAK